MQNSTAATSKCGQTVLPNSEKNRSYSSTEQMNAVNRAIHPYTTSDVKTLIVDDCASTRLLICYYARLLKFRSLTASSGEEGVQLASENTFHIIFMDISLPGFDGFEAIRRIRKLDTTTEFTRFVVCSAHHQTDEWKVSKHDFFLPKPVHRRQFFNQIEDLNLQAHDFGNSMASIPELEKSG